MRCNEARRLIPLHAGDDLEGETAQLDSHIVSCPSCAREMARMRGMVALLRSSGMSAPLPHPDAFMAGIEARLVLQTTVPARGMAFKAIAAVLASAAAVAAVAALLLPAVLDKPASSPSQDQAAPGTSTSDASDAEIARPNSLPVVFGLPFAEIEQYAGSDFETTAVVVPDPASREHPGPQDYMLREFAPVDDTEVCADF